MRYGLRLASVSASTDAVFRLTALDCAYFAREFHFVSEYKHSTTYTTQNASAIPAHSVGYTITLNVGDAAVALAGETIQIDSESWTVLSVGTTTLALQALGTAAHAANGTLTNLTSSYVLTVYDTAADAATRQHALMAGRHAAGQVTCVLAPSAAPAWTLSAMAVGVIAAGTWTSITAVATPWPETYVLARALALATQLLNPHQALATLGVQEVIQGFEIDGALSAPLVGIATATGQMRALSGQLQIDRSVLLELYAWVGDSDAAAAETTCAQIIGALVAFFVDSQSRLGGMALDTRLASAIQIAEPENGSHGWRRRGSAGLEVRLTSTLVDIDSGTSGEGGKPGGGGPYPLQF